MSEQKANMVNWRRAKLCRLVQRPRRIGTRGCGPGRLVVRGCVNGAPSVQGPRVRSWPSLQITGASDTAYRDAHRCSSESRGLVEGRGQESERGFIKETTAGQRLTESVFMHFPCFFDESWVVNRGGPNHRAKRIQNIASDQLEIRCREQPTQSPWPSSRRSDSTNTLPPSTRSTLSAISQTCGEWQMKITW